MLDYKAIASPGYELPDIIQDSIIPKGYIPSYDTIVMLKLQASQLKLKAFITAFYDNSGKDKKFASACWDLGTTFDNGMREAELARSCGGFDPDFAVRESCPF